MDNIQAYNDHNQFGKENNLQLEVLSEGYIRYTMKVEEKHMALPNVMHGGALAGMMDALLSVAAFSTVAQEGKHVATIEFKINYLRAVKKTGILEGVGKVLKKGSQIIFTEAEIKDEEDKIVATGNGSIMVLNR